MKIQILSDLHLEFFRKAPAGMGFPEISPEADVVILAGDIDVGEASLDFAESIAQKFGKEVIWLPGNHEFYNLNYTELKKQFIKRAINNKSGVKCLLGFNEEGLYNHFDKDEVRFVGATMWTDFELYLGSKRLPDVVSAINASAAHINDFRIIRNGEWGLFSPQNSIDANKEATGIIRDILSLPFDGQKIVVTHHGPIKESIHPIYSSDPRYLNSKDKLPGENPSWMINCCFTSNQPELFSMADIWIHGHTHQSIDLKIGNSRLITNPRGYPLAYKDGKVVWENSNFESMKLIEVVSK